MVRGEAVKIQGETQVLGVPLCDAAGRRIGRVVAVACAPDPYSAAWFVVRLRGWHRQVRAVPAGRAEWTGSGALGVPYRRADVLASPVLPGRVLVSPGRPGRVLDDAARRRLETFYVPARAS